MDRIKIKILIYCLCFLAAYLVPSDAHAFVGTAIAAITGAVLGYFGALGTLGVLGGALLMGGLAAGSWAISKVFSPDVPEIGMDSATYANDHPRLTVNRGRPVAIGFGFCRVAGNLVRQNDLVEGSYSKAIVCHGQGEWEEILDTWVNDIHWSELDGNHSTWNHLGTVDQSGVTNVFTEDACNYRGLAVSEYKLEKTNELYRLQNINVVAKMMKCLEIGESSGGTTSWTRNPAQILWHWYVEIEKYSTIYLDEDAFLALEEYCGEPMSNIDDFSSEYIPIGSAVSIRATSQHGYYAPWLGVLWGLLTGATVANGWLADANSSQRYNIDMTMARVITGMEIVNYHAEGAETDRGINSFILQGSNTASDFTHTDYTDVGSNWTNIQTGLSFSEHSAVDEVGSEKIVINNTTPYRYLSLKIATNHGDADYMGFCAIKFYRGVAGGSTAGEEDNVRYVFDYVFDNKVQISDAKKVIWHSFFGKCVMSQAKIKPVWDGAEEHDGAGSLQNKAVQHAFDTDTNVVKDSFSWQRLESPNKIIVNFVNSNKEFTKDLVSLSDEEDINLRGEKIYEDTCWFITDIAIAKRRASFLYNKARYCDYGCKLTGFPDSQHLEIYDRVTVSDDEAGFNAKDFIITDKDEDAYGRAVYVLESYLSGVYSDNGFEEQPTYGVGTVNPFAPVSLIHPDDVTVSQVTPGAGDTYSSGAVSVVFIAPPDAHYSYTEIWVSTDDSTYYYAGQDSDGTFYLDGLGTFYDLGDTVYVKLPSVSTLGVKNPLPATAHGSTTIDSDPALGPGALPDTPPDEYLMAHYSFDEGSGLIAHDSSINGRDGTISAAATWSEGVSGKMLDFDTTYEVDVPIAVFNQNSGTWSCWINIDSNNGNVRIFTSNHTSGSNYEFRTYNHSDGGTLWFYVGNGSATEVVSFGKIDYGTTYHLACTWEYDGATETTLKSYLNGNHIETDTISGQLSIPDDNIQIGAYNSGNRLDGKVDEFRVYNVALTNSQIKAIYLYPSSNLVVPSGGSIFIAGGGDVHLRSTTGNPSNINFYTQNRTFSWKADYANDRLSLFPDTNDVGNLYLGYDHLGTQNYGFLNMYLKAKTAVEINAAADRTGYPRACLFLDTISDIPGANLQSYKDASNYSYVHVDANSGDCAITSSVVSSNGSANIVINTDGVFGDFIQLNVNSIEGLKVEDAGKVHVPVDLIVEAGIWIDARAYGSSLNDTTIQGAITDIGSDVTTLVLCPGAWSITDDLTTNANTTLKILPGAVLTISASKTLTTNGPLIACENAFTGSGSVDVNGPFHDIGAVPIFGSSLTVTIESGQITNGGYGRAEWFGDVDGTADEVQINAALTSCRHVKLLDGVTYSLADSIDAASNGSLFANDWTSIISHDFATADTPTILIDDVVNFKLVGMKIDGQSATAVTSAVVRLGGTASGTTSDVSLEDLWIHDADTYAISLWPGSGDTIKNVTGRKIRIDTGCSSSAISISGYSTGGGSASTTREIYFYETDIYDIDGNGTSINGRAITYSDNIVDQVHFRGYRCDTTSGGTDAGWSANEGATNTSLKEFKIDGTGGDGVGLESAWGFEVSDGHIVDAGGRGVRIFNTGTGGDEQAAAKDGVISNVRISGSGDDGIELRGGLATTNPSVNITIRDCEVSTSTNHGIEVGKAEQCKILYNTCYNNGGLENAKRGITVVSGASLPQDANQIIGNICHGSGNYDSGTATSGGASTLTDSGASWATNELATMELYITGGTGSGQNETIASNTGTVITIDTTWSTNPDATSTYEIRSHTNQDYGMRLLTRDGYVIVKDNLCFDNIEDDLLIGASSPDYIIGEVHETYFGTIAAGTDDERPVFTAPGKNGTVIFGWYVVDAAGIVQDDSHYITFSLYDKATDGNSSNTIGSANTKSTGGVNIVDYVKTEVDTTLSLTAHAILENGTVVSMKKADTGDGKATDEMRIILDYLTY